MALFRKFQGDFWSPGVWLKFLLFLREMSHFWPLWSILYWLLLFAYISQVVLFYLQEAHPCRDLFAQSAWLLDDCHNPKLPFSRVVSFCYRAPFLIVWDSKSRNVLAHWILTSIRKCEMGQWLSVLRWKIIPPCLGSKVSRFTWFI